jgi:hypothetical protein
MPKKIGVAIPSHAYWIADFGVCTTMAFATTALQAPPEGLELHIFNRVSSLLPDQRSHLVKEMQKQNCTHIMWLDSDMTFPSDTILRLLAHNKRVVGVNYVRKYPPYLPTAVDLNGKYCYTAPPPKKNHKGDVVERFPQKTGLEEVMHVGLGACLMDITVFDEIPEPWFPIIWEVNMKKYVGEDVFFCHSLKSKKIPIFVDHDLSAQIGHVGSLSFTTDLTGLDQSVLAEPEAHAAAEKLKPMRAVG